MKNVISTEERINLFWARVDKEPDSDCWNWNGKITRDGYGCVKIFGVFRGAHRVAYEIEYQDAADGLCVMHTCDNPKCCNPAHLFKGTHTDNMQDMIEKGRRGFAKYNPVKINLEIARQIRAEFRQGASKQSLARQYGISPLHVRDIIKNKCWKEDEKQSKRIEICRICNEREAWSANLKRPICARCAVEQWQQIKIGKDE